jgi:hypothetical protein
MTMTPTIHLNGTAGESLIKDNLKALRSLQDAVEALQGAAPNGRDYYVEGPQAYSVARREHETRLHRLADTIHEINAIAEAGSGRLWRSMMPILTSFGPLVSLLIAAAAIYYGCF